MAERAQKSADLVFGLFQAIAVERHEVVLNPDLVPVDFEVGLNRNIDEIVLRLPEDAALGFRHADHFKRKPIDLDGFSDSIGAWEKTIFKVMADDRNAGFVLILNLGVAATRLHLRI